jgi:ABC-2 type transport system permease protein
MNAELKTMTALVRREMWEHRAFWLVPTVVASLCTLMLLRAGFEVLGDDHAADIAKANVKIAEKIELGSFLDRTDAAATMFAGSGAIFGIIMGFVCFFYLLDSLYSDRRDRSVLFWRSMPVTDRETVFAKLLTGTVFGPLATLCVLLASFVVWSGVVAMFGAAVGFDYWWLGLNPLAWAEAFLMLLGVHLGLMLVVAPFVGWILLASSWAPRAPFLWAFLPPLGLALFEEMFLDSNRFIKMIGHHFEILVPQIFEVNSMRDVAIQGDGYKVSIGPAFELSAAYLAEPRLWAGLVLGAAFVAGAIWMRRYRDDAAY